MSELCISNSAENGKETLESGSIISSGFTCPGDGEGSSVPVLISSCGFFHPSHPSMNDFPASQNLKGASNRFDALSSYKLMAGLNKLDGLS